MRCVVAQEAEARYRGLIKTTSAGSYHVGGIIQPTLYPLVMRFSVS